MNKFVGGINPQGESIFRFNHFINIRGLKSELDL